MTKKNYDDSQLVQNFTAEDCLVGQWYSLIYATEDSCSDWKVIYYNPNLKIKNGKLVI